MESELSTRERDSWKEARLECARLSAHTFVSYSLSLSILLSEDYILAPLAG